MEVTVGMRSRENLGPAVLSGNEGIYVKAILFCFVFLIFPLCGISLPPCVETTLVLFVVLRFAHLIHRFCCKLGQERNSLISLYNGQSRFCAWTYAVGDFALDLVLYIFVLYYVTRHTGSDFYILTGAFAVCVVVGFCAHFTKRLSSFEKNDILRRYRLNVGYGLAYFYYYNYLIYFIKYIFKERVQEFANEHRVPVAEKLLILVPYNCVVKKYIDDDHNEIMRARELPPLLLNVAGIRERVYNITVYEPFPLGMNNDYAYLAVEYAQPLKQLRELYAKNIITQKEMQEERESFMYHLHNFLHDEANSYETCILVPYDGQDLVTTLINAANEAS